MKKRIPFLIVGIISLSLSFQPASMAANKVSSFVATFKTILDSSSNQRDLLENNHEKNINLEEEKLATAISLANSTYDKELTDINATYAPQIASANQKAEDAKVLFNKNNKVKVGSSGGSFGGTNLANYLDCPPPVLKAGYPYEIAKRYCANNLGYLRFGDKSPTNNGAVIGGEDWQPGDETTIQLFNADQSLVQSGFANGYIVALNQSVFDSSRIEYKNQLAQVSSLTTRQGNARTAAANKRDAAIATATKARNEAVDELEADYQEQLSQLELNIEIQEKALLASKRAAKETNNFSQAFSTAYKFEFNRQKLNEIADTPWTGFWTFRTINTLIKVTNLADQADSIAYKYNYKTALKFNNSLGGAFTNDKDFRLEMKVAQALFTKVTGSSIKF